jgi:hypothetical protein
MWSEIRFLTHAYRKKLVERGELTYFMCSTNSATEIDHRQRRWKLRTNITFIKIKI